jgi:hypothetical protein
MNVRFAWGAGALLFWIGCGGAFSTTADPDSDAGTGTGTGTSTGGAGSSSTGSGGSTGASGSSGTAGSSSGTAGTSSGSAGSSSGAAGSSTGSGGASGAGGNSGGTGGAGGSSGASWDACDGPGQCVALEKSCCPGCAADVSAYVGVNTKRVDDFHKDLCPLPVACPAIACLPVAQNYIGARCVAGHCQAFDVRQVPEFSACGTDNACQLRAGLGCCICTPNPTWVAVSASGEKALTAAECAPNTACLDCLPVPPPKTLASCTNHVCQVLLAP